MLSPVRLPPPTGVAGAAAAIPAVVRLAHALDAAGLLAFAKAEYDLQLGKYTWPRSRRAGCSTTTRRGRTQTRSRSTARSA